jgi:hypothetical protein
LKKVNGVHIRLIVGVEVQSYIDYAMPVRVMDYDSVEYSRQIREIRQVDRQKHSGQVRLSSISKVDRLTPALTLVLYIGEIPWDSAKNLHGILDFDKVSEAWRPYIADYPLHVLDVCHEPDERLLEFPDDLSCLFLLLKYQKNKADLMKIVQNISAFRHVDEDLYDAVWSYTNEDELLQLKDNYSEEGGINMCQAIRELVADSKQEGYSTGKQEGIVEGYSTGKQEGYCTGKQEGYSTGKQEGYSTGKQVSLIAQTRKKFQKGISAEDCADMLESEQSEIEAIYAAIQLYPEKDDEGIYEELRTMRN